MKKTFLFLGVCVALAACSSHADQPASTTTPKESVSTAEELAINRPTAADKQEDALDHDSLTAANVTAVANQPQIDTSITKIGTGATGAPAGKGAQLLAASDCASCHREREKLLGPAYHDVALRYPATPANIAMLATKVIKGGKGHWGDIPMTPHPGLSQPNAKEMIHYVLSLK